jgi:hypothetical protein
MASLLTSPGKRSRFGDTTANKQMFCQRMMIGTQAYTTGPLTFHEALRAAHMISGLAVTAFMFVHEPGRQSMLQMYFQRG